MLVTDIYHQFHTPANLQQHMRRVAAVGQLVLTNWIGLPVDNRAIIHTLLFHDMAKPITFDLAKQHLFIKDPDELKYLAQNIQHLITQYGNDEHRAVRQIFQEIDLTAHAQQLVANLEWDKVDTLLSHGDMESLLTIYCDMRVGPHGLLSLMERLSELQQRQPIPNFAARLESAQRLEATIQTNVSLDLGKLSATDVENISEELQSFEI